MSFGERIFRPFERLVRPLDIPYAPLPSIGPWALLRLLTIHTAAAVLGCSLKTLRRRIEAGDLPVIRDGRLVRVHPQDLARVVSVSSCGHAASPVVFEDMVG
jgi:excisionase family DNA binding protein